MKEEIAYKAKADKYQVPEEVEVEVEVDADPQNNSYLLL
jgi:hypothetical protein